MKLKKGYAIGVIIWGVAIISLLVTPNIVSRVRIAKAEKEREAMLRPLISIYDSLNDERKKAVNMSELGILRIGNGEIVLIEKNIDISEMPHFENLVKISVDNSVLKDFDEEIELLQAMKRLIISQLNRAQGKLVQYNHGVIMRGSKGDFYMIADKRKYEEFILKYGTDCPTCKDKNGTEKNRNNSEGRKEK